MAKKKLLSPSAVREILLRSFAYFNDAKSMGETFNTEWVSLDWSKSVTLNEILLYWLKDSPTYRAAGEYLKSLTFEELTNFLSSFEEASSEETGIANETIN